MNTFGTVEAHIFGQHDELGRLLHVAKAVVGAASRGDAGCAAVLPRLIELLAGKLRDHLAFEEKHLLPLLLASRSLDDQARAGRLAEDHARQRESFFALSRQWHTSSASDPSLVEAFAQLEQELRGDIAEEEQWLLEHTSQPAATSLSP